MNRQSKENETYFSFHQNRLTEVTWRFVAFTTSLALLFRYNRFVTKSSFAHRKRVICLLNKLRVTLSAGLCYAVGKALVRLNYERPPPSFLIYKVNNFDQFGIDIKFSYLHNMNKNYYFTCYKKIFKFDNSHYIYKQNNK